jgi:hypothetical protein
MSSCFMCISCGQGQGKLDGDVFIVTEGAQNVKLGLVEVRVLPYEETKNSIAKTKAGAERETADLQPKLDAARQALASAKATEAAGNDPTLFVVELNMVSSHWTFQGDSVASEHRRWFKSCS